VICRRRSALRGQLLIEGRRPPRRAAGPTRRIVVDCCCRTTVEFASADEPADPALTLALVAVIALLGGLALGALAVVVLGLGRRRT
jgi:hypothetical protein